MIESRKAKMKAIIRNAYQIDRPVTDQELNEEIMNLNRKHRQGYLDDHQSALYCAMKAVNP